MKKVSIRKIMLIFAVVVAVCLIGTVNYATSDVNALIENITRLDSNPTTETTETQATQDNNQIANLTVLPATNANTTNTTTTLPKTGVDDTMMWFLIAVSAVAAVYTYKKVRDYNV